MLKTMSNEKAITTLLSNTKYNVTCVPTDRPLQRASRCISCGQIAQVDSGAKMFTFPQSNKVGACLCARCRGLGNLKSYYDENNTRVGKQTSGKYAGITTSLELETIGNSSTMKVALLKQDFIATHDGTVDIEYKSPIFNNAHSIGIFSNTVQWGNEKCNFNTLDARCGCHTHYGLSHNEFDFRRVDYSIFDAYLDKINSLSRDARIAFFGRDFGQWARAHIACEHTSCVNNEHEYTVEFRLPKFINARQYMRCYYMHRDVFTIALMFWRGQIDADSARASIAHQMGLWFDTI